MDETTRRAAEVFIKQMILRSAVFSVEERKQFWEVIENEASARLDELQDPLWLDDPTAVIYKKMLRGDI